MYEDYERCVCGSGLITDTGVCDLCAEEREAEHQDWFDGLTAERQLALQAAEIGESADFVRAARESLAKTITAAIERACHGDPEEEEEIWEEIWEAAEAGPLIYEAAEQDEIFGPRWRASKVDATLRVRLADYIVGPAMEVASAQMTRRD